MKSQKLSRKFWPENFDAGNPDVVKEGFNDLINQEFDSFATYLNWIYKMDELSVIIGEEGSWRYYFH